MTPQVRIRELHGTAWAPPCTPVLQPSLPIPIDARIRYPSAAEISQMILASELQLQQLPLAPVSPGVFRLMLQLQPQSVTVLAFSCDDTFT
jgi:hypothetical protein